MPVGPACEECFEIGTEVLMYETVEDFFVDMDGNKELQRRGGKIRERKRNPNKPVDFKVGQVSKSFGRVAKVNSTCITKTSAELRALMGVQRLSKELMKNVPWIPQIGTEIDEGLEDDADSNFKMWLFPKPSAQREVVLTDYVDLTVGTSALMAKDNMFEGHSKHVFDKLCDKFTADGYVEVSGEGSKAVTIEQ